MIIDNTVSKETFFIKMYNIFHFTTNLVDYSYQRNILSV